MTSRRLLPAPPLALALLSLPALLSALPAPPFSWDTLPVFWHSANASGPLSDDTVRFVATHFSMATIEKFQGPCANAKSPSSPPPSPSCKQEEVIVAELARIKAANPNISTVFYYNSVLDFPQYSVHARMLQDPSMMLAGKQGKPVKMRCPSPATPCDVFDLGQAKVRELFIEVCTNATKSGVVDGCFVDRAVDGTPAASLFDSAAEFKAYQQGHIDMMAELQRRLGGGPVIANHAYGPPHDASTGVTFAMAETFGANNASINLLLETAANHRGIQAHGRAGDESEIAAFLVGAGHRAYYGFGGWSDPSGQAHWSRVFSNKLGDPTGPAAYNPTTGVWTRSFGGSDGGNGGSGGSAAVHVTFDTSTNKGTVGRAAAGWVWDSSATGDSTPTGDSSNREERERSVAALMTKVATYYVDHAPAKELTDCGWKHSAFLQGVMAMWRLTKDARWRDHALRWAAANQWRACNYPSVLTEHAGANDMSCGQTYAELYMSAEPAPGDHRNASWLASIRSDVVDKIVARPAVDDWWWVDAYFMALPLFAQLGNLTGAGDAASSSGGAGSSGGSSSSNSSAYHAKGLALFKDSAFRRGLWSSRDGLFFRDQTYMNKTAPDGEHHVYWGRGNGWAAGALARALEYTPTTHPAYAIYADHLRAMAKSLAAAQSRGDGMWRADILDPNDDPTNKETTGSAGMAFGLAYGVNSGVLDARVYKPVVLKAWEGLQAVVHGDGRLGYCQPVGGGPAKATADDTSDFCVGLWLLAASEVAKM